MEKRKFEARFTQEEFMKCREDYRDKKITKEEIFKLVKTGQLTPAEYTIITREDFPMYKDVRRDLLKD